MEAPGVGGDECEELEEAGLGKDAIIFEMVEIDPCISIQAVNGIPQYQTMRVTGHYGRRPIQLLIDSGNTYNFLDIELPKKLGCKMEPICIQLITVADGSQLHC